MIAASMSWTLAYYLSEWAIRIAALWYLPRRMRPAAARTWLLLIFLLPWPGAAVYLFIGRVRLPEWRLAMQRRAAAALGALRDKSWQQTSRTRPSARFST